MLSFSSPSTFGDDLEAGRGALALRIGNAGDVGRASRSSTFSFLVMGRIIFCDASFVRPGRVEAELDNPLFFAPKVGSALGRLGMMDGRVAAEEDIRLSAARKLVIFLMGGKVSGICNDDDPEVCSTLAALAAFLSVDAPWWRGGWSSG
ncbi:MAG: hypothetical protein ACE5GN_04370 [Waddliaceae bacterium]